MKILVVGSGGREHALVWKLASERCQPEIYCAPGNGGTAGIATNVDVSAEDVGALVAWAVDNQPDLTVVGPEVPLCAGLVDELAAAGLRAFGPSKDAARMEGSKAFAKDVMVAAGVPTAAAETFTEVEPALAYARELGAPLVVKADGLAAGKGVLICNSLDEAEKAINSIMVDTVFGAAGSELLIEEFLEGEEASILALVDGESIVMLASSQDHKRALDNDQGPNTGGMGAYSPAPVVTDDLWPAIREQIFEPTLSELQRRGVTYKGVLYAGLMIDNGALKVLEFNCRFGDPETQAVLARLASDLSPALEACIDGTLSNDLVTWREEAAVCVVMASGGYPGSYEKGKKIEGLAAAGRLGDTVVFHAGTALEDDAVVTSGGRVLGVTSLGQGIAAAVDAAYRAVKTISFEDAHYRTDIASRALSK